MLVGKIFVMALLMANSDLVESVKTEQWPPEMSLEGLLIDFTKTPKNYSPCVQIQYDFSFFIDICSFIGLKLIYSGNKWKRVM